MKILIVSLLKRSVTPTVTAARPRMIFDLATGLIKKGHNVSILGTGDSVVDGVEIIPVIPKGFQDMGPYENPFYAHTGFLVKMAKKLEEIAGDFDVVHNHTYPEFINLLVERNISTPVITTAHAQMTPEMDDVLSTFSSRGLVAISEAAKKLAHKAEIWRVIHNGVDTNLYQFQEQKEDYMLWLGRMSKARNESGGFVDPKGVGWAIKLAQKTGEKLKIAGNIEDIDFYKEEIEPHLSDTIELVSPISSEQPLSKKEVVTLMQGAKIFLMTVNWYEPFGLVMAEAMSCGTPVIGFDRGSVSELVESGKTGFVVDPLEEVAGLEKALLNIDMIQNSDCRKRVEDMFSLERMVEGYEKAYQDAIKEVL